MTEALKDITGGTVGGVLLVAVGHPFDTLKVRLQTQSVTNPVYSGLSDCVSKIYKSEGLAGFYKGVASPLYGQILMNSWQFGVWGSTKKLFENEKKEIEVADYFKAGAITGGCVALVECPVDLFKTQLQTNPKFTTFFGCVGHIVKNYGIRGCYQGLGATIGRNVPAVSAYFGFYEYTKKMLCEEGQKTTELSALKLMAAGSVGGFFYWSLTYPIDVVKTTMQADTPIRDQRTYKTVLGTFSQLYKESGTSRFFKGFTPCMMRSIPANAVCFAGYELTVKYLNS